jgi:hypothetical protein
MTRPNALSQVVADRFPLSAEARRKLAALIGCEELPPSCADELAALLGCHRRAAAAERRRERKAPGGKVTAAIVQATTAVQQLTAVDTGLDAETRRVLKRAAEAFVAAAEARLATLRSASRLYPHQELLRLTCPLLRKIFEEHVQQGFDTRGNLRRFAWLALNAAAVVRLSLDESHLDALDEFLDGDRHPAIS